MKLQGKYSLSYVYKNIRIRRKILAHAKIQRPLHDGDVLIDRVSVRRDIAAGEFADSHHETALPTFSGSFVEDLDILRHRGDWDDAVLTRLFRVAQHAHGSK